MEGLSDRNFSLLAEACHCPSSINFAFIQASPFQKPSIAPAVLRDNLWALECSPAEPGTDNHLAPSQLEQKRLPMAGRSPERKAPTKSAKTFKRTMLKLRFGVSGNLPRVHGQEETPLGPFPPLGLYSCQATCLEDPCFSYPVTHLKSSCGCSFNGPSVTSLNLTHDLGLPLSSPSTQQVL